MRQYLLPRDGAFYKANLHCHSTVSDGKLTPEELKTAYKAHGYSVLAYTDHEQLRDHSDLNDSDFLAITSYEVGIREFNTKTPTNRIMHMNFFAKDPHQTGHVCLDRTQSRRFCHPAELADTLLCLNGEYERVYSPETVNHMVREAKKYGFIVSYNHPKWGMETPAEYLQYDGFFTVEIYNHSCFMDLGLNEENINVYDDLLRAGKRLACSCNDDNHNRKLLDPDFTDSFGGFNMIKAPSLTYEAVLNALETGDFYASRGPEILDLYVEDGKLHVKTGPARDILLNTATRRGAHAHARSGETITEAAFDIRPDYGYLRVTVIDREGRSAYSRAYFLDTIHADALGFQV